MGRDGEVFELKSGYGGKQTKSFRAARSSDCREMAQQSRQYVEFPEGWRRVTITSVKTWKTRPDIWVKWKYGMWQYGTSVYDNTGLVNGIRFLIEC